MSARPASVRTAPSLYNALLAESPEIMGIDQEINVALTQPTDLTCQGKQEAKGKGRERG